jgi:uncharacterized protein YerC
LIISVHEAEKLSVKAIGRFVEAIEDLRFEDENRQEVYRQVEQVLESNERSTCARRQRISSCLSERDRKPHSPISWAMKRRALQASSTMNSGRAARNGLW